jgi:DNA repair protein RadC
VTTAPVDFAYLSDRDLLTKLIGVRESRRLYHGSLQPLFAPTTEGRDQNDVCVAARELVRRWLDEELRRECSLTAPQSVRDYLRLFFAGQEYESFVALWLDAQNRLIAAKEMFRGTLTQTSVYPREIVKEALRQNAGAVIFSHNHPSGVAEPSRADELLTTNLKQALALVDVKVLDHFIVAGASTLSFAERGLL